MKPLHKLLILATLLFPIALHAQLIVDCTGVDHTAYPSINAALPDAGPGATILVTGPCNESVNLVGFNNLNLGAWSGQTATINGWVLIDHSSQIYLYGLNVTNPNPGGDGIIVAFGKWITVDTCNSSGNGGYGLNVGLSSDVVVNATGSFNNNGFGGMIVGGNSFLALNAWSAPIDISNNFGAGIFSSDEAVIGTNGQTTITNNQGSGIFLVGAARAGFGAYYGPNAIQGNAGGGVSVGEASEISFYSFDGGPANLIQSNATFGVSVGTGGQATFFETAQVTDNAGAGVDVFAGGQANFFGPNQILRNGTSGDPLGSGIRVDGNSEAFLRGGNVSHNNGPAILALVNSSVDFTGTTFHGNQGGIIVCDSSATMATDLNPNSHGIHCKMPHSLGNHHYAKTQPKPPDMSRFIAMQAKYKKLATKH